MVCFATLRFAPMYRVTVDGKGVAFARACIAFALARTDADAADIAMSRWGERSAPHLYVKSAVDPIGTGEGGGVLASPSAAAEFFATV